MQVAGPSVFPQSTFIRQIKHGSETKFVCRTSLRLYRHIRSYVYSKTYILHRCYLQRGPTFNQHNPSTLYQLSVSSSFQYLITRYLISIIKHEHHHFKKPILYRPTFLISNNVKGFPLIMFMDAPVFIREGASSTCKAW